MAGAIASRPWRAARVIAKAIGNIQRAVQRKQSRQTLRLLGVDFLQRTRQPPGALDALGRQCLCSHGLGGGVMQEATEGLVAEILVGARVQDKRMPGIVSHLRRHRYKTPPRLCTQNEIVAQSLEHPLLLRRIQIGARITEFQPHRLRKRMRTDSVQPVLQRQPAPVMLGNKRR